MGILKYDHPMSRMAYVRLTPPQANSLKAVADCMSLTVGDLLRFAVDELIEDVPEPRLFTAHVHVSLRRVPPPEEVGR